MISGAILGHKGKECNFIFKGPCRLKACVHVSRLSWKDAELVNVSHQSLTNQNQEEVRLLVSAFKTAMAEEKMNRLLFLRNKVLWFSCF